MFPMTGSGSMGFQTARRELKARVENLLDITQYRSLNQMPRSDEIDQLIHLRSIRWTCAKTEGLSHTPSAIYITKTQKWILDSRNTNLYTFLVFPLPFKFVSTDYRSDIFPTIT